MISTCTLAVQYLVAALRLQFAIFCHRSDLPLENGATFCFSWFTFFTSLVIFSDSRVFLSLLLSLPTSLARVRFASLSSRTCTFLSPYSHGGLFLDYAGDTPSAGSIGDHQPPDLPTLTYRFDFSFLGGTIRDALHTLVPSRNSTRSGTNSS